MSINQNNKILASDVTTSVKAAMDKANSAISGLSVSGKTITYTKGDGTTGTITTQDTTYSSGTGITIDNNKIFNDGVLSVMGKKGNVTGLVTRVNNIAPNNQGFVTIDIGMSLVETGFGTYGKCFRYSDGLQICYSTGELTDTNDANLSITFPKPFNEVPAVIVTPTARVRFAINTVTATGFNYRTESSNTYSFYYTAIGKWK